MVLDNKEQVHIVISRNTMDRFRHEIAINRETTRKGLLSSEVEKALNQYIAFQRAQCTQQQNTKLLQRDKLLVEGLPPKVYQLREDICKYLIDSGLYEEVPQYIHEKHLIQAISVLRGTDKRTINNWVRLLKETKVIEESGVHAYRFSVFSFTDYEQRKEKNLAEEKQKEVPALGV